MAPAPPFLAEAVACPLVPDAAPACKTWVPLTCTALLRCVCGGVLQALALAELAAP